MVGNLKNYTKWDIINCLFLISENDKISRNNLKERMLVGEGTTRSILDNLKKKNLIISGQIGHSISKKGQMFIQKMNDSIKIIEINQIMQEYESKEIVGIHIKKTIDYKIKSYMIRDEGIKTGANAVLTLGYDGDKFLMEENNNFIIEKTLEISDAKKDDKLIIVIADDSRLSIISAFNIIEFLFPGILEM